MKIRSGAGEFELTVDKVFKKGRDLVMIGKMGVWESETTVTPEEFADVMKTAAGPVMVMMAKLPFYWLSQAMRGKGK